MFSFENGLEIETVPDVSEFLGNSFNTWDNDSARYIACEEGKFLADGFATELKISFGYSLSFISCLVFLISLLKSF
jgi:hypothetical protein